MDWYDLPGISAEAAKTLIRERQAQNKDDWSVEEECLAVEGPANGIALTHHCRRTVRAGKEVSAVMTRLEYQRTDPGGVPNLSLRSVRDTALLFKIQR